MTVRKVLSIAIVSALLAACSSSSGGGGGNGIRPGDPSLSTVLQQYRNEVSEEKTIDLIHDDKNGYSLKITLDGKTGGTYNFSDLPNGRTELSISLSDKTPQGTTNYSGTMLVYQQPYSVVTGLTLTQGSGDEFEASELNLFKSDEVLGLSTPNTALMAFIAQDAVFEYKGRAFDGKEEGTLNYTMLFGERKGHGSITGFAHTGAITLWPAQLTNDGFVRGGAHLEKDTSHNSAKYELSFFGPNAEEIAGYVYDAGNWQGNKGILGDNEIIFAGNVERKTIP